MAFTPFNGKQIDAANVLIELILPDLDALDNAVALFEEQLEECEDETVGILTPIFVALGEEAFFVSPINENERLIESLTGLVEAWGAYVQFGSRDWEGAFTDCIDVPSLIRAAAIELESYGLLLFFWQLDEERIAGFLAREADMDLVEKAIEMMGQSVYRGIEGIDG